MARKATVFLSETKWVPWFVGISAINASMRNHRLAKAGFLLSLKQFFK
jgi:hypothetical protein